MKKKRKIFIVYHAKEGFQFVLGNGFVETTEKVTWEFLQKTKEWLERERKLSQVIILSWKILEG